MKKKIEPYISIPMDWLNLIRTYEKDGKTVSINHAEIMFLRLIYSYSQNEKNGCYATDDHLAEIFHVKPCTISKYVKELKFAGLINSFTDNQTKRRTMYIQFDNIKSYIRMTSGHTYVLPIYKDISKEDKEESCPEEAQSDCEKAKRSRRECKPKEKQTGKKQLSIYQQHKYEIWKVKPKDEEAKKQSKKMAQLTEEEYVEMVNGLSACGVLPF